MPSACPRSMTRWIVENAAPISSTWSLRCELRATSRTITRTRSGSLRHDRRRILAIPRNCSSAGSSELSTRARRPSNSPQFSRKTRCQDLLLGREVVVEQTVSDTRLLGDVADARCVIPAPGEDPDRRVEDETALLLARRLPIPSGALLCDRTLSQSGRRIRRFADDVPWKANCSAQRPVRPSATGNWKRSVMRSDSAG